MFLLLFFITLSGISDSPDRAGTVSVFFQAVGTLFLGLSNIPSDVLQSHGKEGSTGTMFLTRVLTVMCLGNSNPYFHSF